jgi:hypothetical protein
VPNLLGGARTTAREEAALREELAEVARLGHRRRRRWVRGEDCRAAPFTSLHSNKATTLVVESFCFFPTLLTKRLFIITYSYLPRRRYLLPSVVINKVDIIINNRVPPSYAQANDRLLHELGGPMTAGLRTVN